MEKMKLGKVFYCTSCGEENIPFAETACPACGATDLHAGDPPKPHCAPLAPPVAAVTPPTAGVALPVPRFVPYTPMKPAGIGCIPTIIYSLGHFCNAILYILAWAAGIAIVGGFLCIVLYPVVDAIRSVQKAQTANQTSQMIQPKLNPSVSTQQASPKKNVSKTENALPEKTTQSDSKNLIAQRKRVLLNNYDPSDIKVSKSGDGRSNIAVSMFGRPVVKATRQLSSKQIPYYSVTFSNCRNPADFSIFLRRDNANFNIVCLDVNELAGVLNKVIKLHNDARSSQAETTRKRVPTGARLASTADFDSVMAGYDRGFIFVWNKSNSNFSPDSYPVLESNWCFSSGNLGSDPEHFTIYDALINRKALDVLKTACSQVK